jgi:hypothetical protein
MHQKKVALVNLYRYVYELNTWFFILGHPVFVGGYSLVRSCGTLCLIH